MDEYGKDIANESNDMAPEPMINASAELRKRRTTRIVQAVPLVVTGVDALGRPFVERTSSLIINCHGCRYQSKHYVLKNMWVTLEIPHPETGQPPRNVRGRVAWIQRPRTVRQLFQVALELEDPGNVWGIAFPPDDWFTYAPSPEPKPIPATGSELPTGALSEGIRETPQASVESEVPPPAMGTDNLRMFPAPTSTTDASLQLARQVARLIADAKQQIYAAAKDAASQAVSAERRVAFEQWEQKFAAAREEVTNEADRAIERIQADTETHTRSAYAAAGATLLSELPKWLAPQLEQLTYELTRRLAASGTQQAAEHERQMQEVSEKIQNLCEHAQEVGARIGAQAAQAEARIQERSEAAVHALDENVRKREEAFAAHKESLGAAAKQMREQLGAAIEEAEATLQDRITKELDAAQARVQNAAVSAAAAAREQVASGVQDQIQEVRTQLQEHIEREAERHAAVLREAAAGMQAEVDRHLVGVRETVQTEVVQLENTVASAQGSLQQLERHSSQLSDIEHQSLSEFQTQLDDVLVLHRNELHRRSEALFEELNGRIRNTFDEVIHEALGKFDEQIRSLVDPHISRTEEAVQRLAGGRSLLDGALALQQDRIRNAADEAFGESLARFRENLGSVEQLLQDSAQSVISRNLTELEGKAGDVRHQAVEEIYKSAEWYEKKAQTQINSLTEKAIEQAGGQLREKAGEVSGVFASEIDHASRNFVQHTQTQMAEVVRDAFDRARALFGEAADTTMAAFTDEIQRHARSELDGFEAAVRKSSEESREVLERAHGETTRRLTAEQEQFLRKFQASMHAALESGVAEVQQKVQAGLSPMLDTWKSLTEAYQGELRNAYQRMGNEAAEQFRGRLENASNSWLVATVAMLNRQSQDVVTGIARTAEEKLRATCGEVFSGIGETLRGRLQKITAEIGKPPANLPR